MIVETVLPSTLINTTAMLKCIDRDVHSEPSAPEPPAGISGAQQEKSSELCPVCLDAAPIGRSEYVPPHQRRRICMKYGVGETRLTVAALLRNRDFGLLPGHWTVRDVVNTKHWIQILREGCDPAEAVEGIDFKRMPVDWSPSAVLLGCCPKHNKGVHGVADDCLDWYGGCQAVAMGLPHVITSPDVPCNVDLDNVSTPPTPPPF